MWYHGAAGPREGLQRWCWYWARLAAGETGCTVPHHCLDVPVNAWPPDHTPAALFDSDNSQVTFVNHGQDASSQGAGNHRTQSPRYAVVVPARKVISDTMVGRQFLRHLGGPSLLDKYAELGED